MGKIYLENGYLNVDYIWNKTKMFCPIVGARGTGKSYGFLEYTIEHEQKFILLRRLKTQIETITGGEGNNPFKRLNINHGWDIQPAPAGEHVIFKNGEDVAGYAMALSTLATVRGGDWSDVDVIIFDEFIAMDNERPIKNEFNAFMNFVETVNRNRELENKPSVKVFMLGNANRLNNPYFAGWRLMKIVLRMIKGRQMVYRSEDGNKLLILLIDSPISARKKETALYSDARDDFIKMALENVFYVDETATNSVPLKDLRHVVSVGEIGIYLRKSNGNYYVSETINRINWYDGQGMPLKMVIARYRLFSELYLYGKMEFENYECELLFREYFNLI